MSNDWRKPFTELLDYVNLNPEIEINSGVISIPEKFCVEFYEYFDATRFAFISDAFEDQLAIAQDVSQNILKLSKELMSRLDLKEISSPAVITKFLKEPERLLSKGLFDPLFQVLKGKQDLHEFESVVKEPLCATFDSLNALAYEEWVALSLIKLLEPAGFFQVEVNDSVRLTTDLVGDQVYRLRDAVTEVRETSILSFNHEKHARLTTPDTIFYSNKVKRFVSLRLDFLQPLWIATNPIDGIEWMPIDRSNVLPNCILIYSALEPQELVLVADAERMYRPDAVVVCWTGSTPGLAQEVKGIHAYLKPRLGTYVVSVSEIPESIASMLGQHLTEPVVKPETTASTVSPEVETQTPESTGVQSITRQEKDQRFHEISLLNVGFQTSLLEPIVEAYDLPRGVGVDSDMGP